MSLTGNSNTLTLLITNHTLEIIVTKNMANKSNVYYMALGRGTLFDS